MAGASGVCAGLERGESVEAEEVPGRPAGEGVFSLMTMVWYVARAWWIDEDSLCFSARSRGKRATSCRYCCNSPHPPRRASPAPFDNVDSRPGKLDISDISQ
ncbi:hypothetical protein BDI4_2030001 [Burkholderia diffusa]|nr:hypothetical protein BDI4_2030001 [Burkholderia diffusa]